MYKLIIFLAKKSLAIKGTVATNLNIFVLKKFHKKKYKENKFKYFIFKKMRLLL